MQRNGMQETAYQILIGDLVDDPSIRKQVELSGPYDLVVANIVAGVIIPLTPLIPGYLKPGAPYLVSGIIKDRLEEVLCQLHNCGFEPEQIKTSEEWNAILAYRK